MPSKIAAGILVMISVIFERPRCESCSILSQQTTNGPPKLTSVGIRNHFNGSDRIMGNLLRSYQPA